MHWSKNPKIREEVLKKIASGNKGKLKGKKRPPFSEKWKINIGKAKKGIPLFAKRIKVDEIKICKEYINGESSLILSDRYKISWSTVINILKRNNFQPRNHKEKTLNAIKFGRISNSELQRKIVKEKWQGKNNPRWSGGWYVDKYNYKWIHDNKGRWRKEHRVIVEKIIGRDLKRSETIHHIDEDKLDNKPENLYYFPNDNLHKRYHGLKNKPRLKSNLDSIK